ncbi:MAG: hypothetical protein MIO90_05145 [Methanomassiliicoccales archaeon]|nr:hypothetical protein [Methanomassiliicoccales archaeon]
MGNSYTAVCYSEGRSNAGVFMKRMAKGKKGRLSKELLDAAAAYVQGTPSPSCFRRGHFFWYDCS